MIRPAVLLFDIDGTLLLAGGAGRRAMELAFDDLHGRPDVISGVDFRGMTDGPLLRGALSAIGQPSDAASIARVVELYLSYLEETVASAEDFRVLPGVQLRRNVDRPARVLLLPVVRNYSHRGLQSDLGAPPTAERVFHAAQDPAAENRRHP